MKTGTKIAPFATAAAALGGCTTAWAEQAVGSTGSAMGEARVAVDFSQSRGDLLHTERLNTWDNGDPEPELREDDIAFLVDQGLDSKIVRVGIGVDSDICDLQAQSCDFSGADWLFDVSKLTESLVVHITPEGFSSLAATRLTLSRC